MDLPIVFMAGMPRSGSTLFMNLLGQHPQTHVTPTNALVDVVASVRDGWMGLEFFQSQGLDSIKPRMLGLLRGTIAGFYEAELAAGKVPVDKSRAWLEYIELMEQVLGRRVQVIVTVRRVADCVASFEKIRKTGDDRAQSVLHDTAVLGSAISRLRGALSRGMASRLGIVPYGLLTREPAQTMDRVARWLGLPPHRFDANNVQQLTHEDDTGHGIPHVVRPQVEPDKGNAWQGVLSGKLVAKIDAVYRDIDSLASGGLVLGGS